MIHELEDRTDRSSAREASLGAVEELDLRFRRTATPKYDRVFFSAAESFLAKATPFFMPIFGVSKHSRVVETHTQNTPQRNFYNIILGERLLTCGIAFLRDQSGYQSFVMKMNSGNTTIPLSA